MANSRLKIAKESSKLQHKTGKKLPNTFIFDKVAKLNLIWVHCPFIAIAQPSKPELQELQC